MAHQLEFDPDPFAGVQPEAFLIVRGGPTR